METFQGLRLAIQHFGHFIFTDYEIILEIYYFLGSEGSVDSNQQPVGSSRLGTRPPANEALFHRLNPIRLFFVLLDWL